jgi:hypothetical protein
LEWQEALGLGQAANSLYNLTGSVGREKEIAEMPISAQLILGKGVFAP